MFCLLQEDEVFQAVLLLQGMAKYDKEKNKMDVYQQHALAGKNRAKCHCKEDTQVMLDTEGVT